MVTIFFIFHFFNHVVFSVAAVFVMLLVMQLSLISPINSCRRLYNSVCVITNSDSSILDCCSEVLVAGNSDFPPCQELMICFLPRRKACYLLVHNMCFVCLTDIWRPFVAQVFFKQKSFMSEASGSTSSVQIQQGNAFNI